MFEEQFRQQHQGHVKPSLRSTDRPIPCRIIEAAESLDDELYVHVQSMGPNARRGPCRWMPRGALMPKGGEAAIIEFDTDGLPWIVAWWPYD